MARLKDGRRMMAVSKRTADILDGTEDLSAWDDEELLRGRRRSSDGRFMGSAPLVVPQSVHEERMRRTMTGAYELLRHNLEAAIQVLCDIATDETANSSDRIRASSIIVERILPKLPERVDLNLGAERPLWMSVLADAVEIVNDSATVLDVYEVDDDEIIFE